MEEDSINQVSVLLDGKKGRKRQSVGRKRGISVARRTKTRQRIRDAERQVVRLPASHGSFELAEVTT